MFSSSSTLLWLIVQCGSLVAGSSVNGTTRTLITTGGFISTIGNSELVAGKKRYIGHTWQTLILNRNTNANVQAYLNWRFVVFNESAVFVFVFVSDTFAIAFHHIHLLVQYKSSKLAIIFSIRSKHIVRYKCSQLAFYTLRFNRLLITNNTFNDHYF